MANKVSTQLLVTRGTRTRVRALAVINDEVQAETLRELVMDALPRLEGAHAEAIERLYAKLSEAGIDHESGIDAILEAKIEFRKVMDMSPAQLKRALKA